MVTKKAKKTEHDKLILNSYNKIRTTGALYIKNHDKIKKSWTMNSKSWRSEIYWSNIIAETFNEYFVPIAEDIKRQGKNNVIISKDHNNSIGSHTHFMEPALYEPYPNMKCNCTMMKDIEKIIKSLQIQNSHGYDEILTKILKISSPFISWPLNYIRNKIILWGVFPDRLKYTVVKLLHKNGDRCDESNYRPVSPVTSLSNTFNGNVDKGFTTTHQI